MSDPILVDLSNNMNRVMRRLGINPNDDNEPQSDQSLNVSQDPLQVLNDKLDSINGKINTLSITSAKVKPRSALIFLAANST